MKTLRVQVSASAGYYLNPLTWSWPALVDDFRASFTGQPWQMMGSPITDGLKGVLYIGAPNGVAESQLDGLRRNWSDRVTGVKVDAVAIVNGMQTEAKDRAALQAASVLGGFTKSLGDKASAVIKIALVGGLLVLGAYVYTHRRGGE